MRTYQVYNFRTMSATESQNAAEDSQNKEIIQLVWVNVLQKDLISFPPDLEIKESFLVLTKAQPVSYTRNQFDQACSVKMSG